VRGHFSHRCLRVPVLWRAGSNSGASATTTQSYPEPTRARWRLPRTVSVPVPVLAFVALSFSPTWRRQGFQRDYEARDCFPRGPRHLQWQRQRVEPVGLGHSHDSGDWDGRWWRRSDWVERSPLPQHQPSAAVPGAQTRCACCGLHLLAMEHITRGLGAAS
jgi:hypothetical protein